MYLKRTLEEAFKKALKQFPVCLVTGSRQAGKSTMLQKSLKGYRYVSLDEPLKRTEANNDPELFLSSYPPPVIIDEIQYAPELFTYLKIAVDKDRQKYGQYILTGSQTFPLMKGVSESLAGRIAIFNLYPLSWKELSQTIPSSVLYTDSFLAGQITQGFYPEFISNKNIDPYLWFSSFISTYVERDIRNVKSISDLSRFQTFIRLLALRAGKLLNLSEIAKECGITQPTAKSWLSVLESTFMIYLLKPYYKNQTKRLVKSPKLYFVDTGILCYLLGIDSRERFLNSPERGALFENMVVMEFKKKFASGIRPYDLYFYRTSGGIEVDLIVDRGAKIDAYEIKCSKTINKNMTASLATIAKDHACNHLKLLSLHEEDFNFTPSIQATHWLKEILHAPNL